MNLPSNRIIVILSLYFGGSWINKDGWYCNHPGIIWNWIDLMWYRFKRRCLLTWYSIQIFYYKLKIKIK